MGKQHTLELHRALPIANVALLAILGCVAAGLILGGDKEPSPASISETQVPKTQADLLEKQPVPANPRVILERDIFGSGRVDSAKKESQEDAHVSLPAKPVAQTQLQLRLLGTVAGDEEVACAVIEDLNTKMQDVYVAGDSIQGARIERIERNRVILFSQGRQETLNLCVANDDSVSGENDTGVITAKEPTDVEAVKVISSTEREIDKRAFLRQSGGIDTLLGRVRLSPCIASADMKAQGLRITGLDGLSMAKYVGLGDGDVIQAVNGQKMTDTRKAFQVLRRARLMPSADIELLSGTEKKTLSFRMK